MAERRMFAKTIIDSDAFLEMPLSSRLLYYDLGMRADDDGFINNPKKIMRCTGAGEDDIKLLIAKKFIIPFDSGVVVIKHWLIHNYIRKDRYDETKYMGEKASLFLDENSAYTQNNEKAVALPYTKNTLGRPVVDQRLPQVKLGKDRLDKDNIYIPESDAEKPKTKDVKHKYGEFGRVLLTNKQYEKLIEDYGKGVIDNQIKKLDEYIQSNNNKNKYSDWNLVLRKSIRDNWFKSNNSQSNKNDGWCMRTEEELASEEPLPF